MSKVIGIDLGTTNSCVAVMEDGEPLVIPNEEGSRTTPSVVAFTREGERLVGQVARRQAVTNPERTFFAVKRLIGRRFEDESIARSAALVPYTISEAENGDAWVSTGDKNLSPPQISAIVLEKMKATAEAYLGERVERAIITVPAYFNDSQRQATKDAGRIAGLEVERIINEPTAAALAYGLDKDEDMTLAVFDLGGGTFDVSILQIEAGVFEVKATNGDTFLGGEDWDNRIVETLLEAFEERNGIDLSEDVVAMQRLKEAAEKAKCELSSVEDTDVNLPFIATGPNGPVHLMYNLTRATLEEICEDLLERLLAPCAMAVSDSGLATSSIDAVILVGGMTRMPSVRSKVETIFGRSPEEGVNPDEVVAIGASVQGSVLTGEVKDILLLDVTPLTLGIEVSGGLVEPIIERNTTIPCRKSKVFTTALDNQDLVRVHVTQGERDMAGDNRSLGRMEMFGIPPAPRGLPEIEVSFEIDANGIMSVRAKDLGTGQAQSMRIVSSSGLSDDEITGMLADAETYRDTDADRRDLAEAKNTLDGLIYTTRRSMQEYGSALGAEDASHLKDSVAYAEQCMDADDIDVIQDAHDRLALAAQKLAESIYEAAHEAAAEEADETFEDSWDDDDDDLFDDELGV
ncbi:MAG: molecular chaperone DnaK [Proteobacteria bacterium]|nr:molecular chaperone DnaK [Pseudomonadota bacterium]MCP4917716.1 molecular chaperone DnaK [Pseudomonadota bacterium]